MWSKKYHDNSNDYIICVRSASPVTIHWFLISLMFFTFLIFFLIQIAQALACLVNLRLVLLNSFIFDLLGLGHFCCRDKFMFMVKKEVQIRNYKHAKKNVRATREPCHDTLLFWLKNSWLVFFGCFVWWQNEMLRTLIGMWWQGFRSARKMKIAKKKRDNLILNEKIMMSSKFSETNKNMFSCCYFFKEETPKLNFFPDVPVNKFYKKNPPPQKKTKSHIYQTCQAVLNQTNPKISRSEKRVVFFKCEPWPRKIHWSQKELQLARTPRPCNWKKNLNSHHE